MWYLLLTAQFAAIEPPTCGCTVEPPAVQQPYKNGGKLGQKDEKNMSTPRQQEMPLCPIPPKEEAVPTS